MNKNIIKTLAFMLIAGSLQALPTLSRIDIPSLGAPMHEVTVDENHYRTVYIAYPQESLKTLEQRKVIAGTVAALATAGAARWGFKTVTTLLSNTASVLGNLCVRGALSLKNLISTTPSPMPTHEPSLITANLARYGCYAAASAFAAHTFWKEYNSTSRVFDRLLHMNTARNSILNSESLVTYFPDNGNAGTSVFSTPVPVTHFPHTHQEIAAINRNNPNLIWFRASQEVIDDQDEEDDDATTMSDEPGIVEPEIIPQPVAAPIVAAEPEVHECSICHEDLNDETQLATLACNHTFHQGCIDEWIANNPTCPICRADIPAEHAENNQE